MIALLTSGWALALQAAASVAAGIRALARVIGWGGVAALSLAVYDYGIPLPSSLGWVTSVPVIGWVAEGEIGRSSAAAVKTATASLVSQAEYNALVVVLQRREQQEQLAAAAAAELRAKITASNQEKSDAEKRLAAELAAHPDPGRPRVSDADVRWMQLHE